MLKLANQSTKHARRVEVSNPHSQPSTEQIQTQTTAPRPTQRNDEIVVSALCDTPTTPLQNMFLDAILDGDSLIRDTHFSVIVEWRCASTLRLVRPQESPEVVIRQLKLNPHRSTPHGTFVDAVRTLVTDAYVIFQRRTPLSAADRQGHRLWDNRFIDSVKVQAMDASHVSLVMAEMTRPAFMDRPRVYTPDTETNIGMNLNQLAKVLRCADDDDRVVLLTDSDPRQGRVYVFIYRPNPLCPEQSFFGDLYDEGSFRDVFHNGDPNRRLRVQLKRRTRRREADEDEEEDAHRRDGFGDMIVGQADDVPADVSGGGLMHSMDGTAERLDEDMLPRKEMVFDLPKVFVDEPAIGVPPTPPGYTILMPSRAFAGIAEHLTSLADTLDISVFFEQESPDLAMEEDGAMIKVRHKVVFSSSYAADLTGRHELRSKQESVTLDMAMDMAEDESAVITVMSPESVEEEDVREGNQEEKMSSSLLITLSFASRYLETFSKAASICDLVRLHMNEDSPIGVTYLGNAGVVIQYFLAPKIQDE